VNSILLVHPDVSSLPGKKKSPSLKCVPNDDHRRDNERANHHSVTYFLTID